MTETEDIGTHYEPWDPIQNKVHLAVIGKAQEELGELQQVLARCIIQGIDEKIPLSDPSKTNRDQLSDELADVEALIHLLREEFNLPHKNVRKVRKIRVQEQWYADIHNGQTGEMTNA